MIRLATCSSTGGAEQDDALLEELAEQARRPLAAVGGLLPDLGDVERVVHRLHHASDSSAGVGSGASSSGRRSGFVGVRDRHVDLGTGRVEGDRGIDDELQRLAAGDVRAYRLQETPPVEIAAHLLRLLARPLGQTVDLGLELLVGRLDRLLDHDRAEREVGEDRLGRSAAHLLDELGLVLAGRGEPLRDRQALRLEPVHEVVEPATPAPGRRAPRAPRCRRGPTSSSSTRSRIAIWAWSLPKRSMRRRLSSRSASTVSDSVFSATHSSVSSGSTLRFASFTSARNATSVPACSPNRSGSSSVNSSTAPGPAPRSGVVERGDEPAGADLVEQVARGQRVDRLAVDRAAEVHRRVVAVDERVVAVLEVGEAVAELVDLARRRPRRRPA